MVSLNPHRQLTSSIFNPTSPLRIKIQSKPDTGETNRARKKDKPQTPKPVEEQTIEEEDQSIEGKIQRESMVYCIEEEEEEDPWKCRKHSSKQRTTGVCSTCLRDRLIRLCPECAKIRPCSCYPSTCSSSSSSSTSSFTLSSSSDIPKSGVGVIGRMSNLIDNEPAFRRSRSVAFPFLSRSKKEEVGNRLPPSGSRSSRLSFWSVFKTKKGGEVLEKEKEVKDERKRMMLRSRSVGIPCYSDPDQIPVNDVRLKSRSWYFPSPINVFRQPKSSKINQERSPLCRG